MSEKISRVLTLDFIQLIIKGNKLNKTEVKFELTDITPLSIKIDKSSF